MSANRNIRTRRIELKFKCIAATVLAVAAVDATAAGACLNGSVIASSTSAPLVARQGSAFSSTLYDPAITSNNRTHNPVMLTVKVTNKGQPVSGCDVAWQPRGAGSASGWLFPVNASTGADGVASAWWIAGSGGAQTAVASIRRFDGTAQSVAIGGSAQPHRTRANSVHLNYQQASGWTAFSVDVTPEALAPTTYWEAIGWPGAYTGIQSVDGKQNGLVLFSVWDANGKSPQIIAKGPGVSCTQFGGEGTGYKCSKSHAPVAGRTYRFMASIAPVAGQNQTDYSVWFTDTSTNVRELIATLRYQKSLQSANFANSFVEDWATQGASCLDATQRAGQYGNVWAFDRVAGRWVAVKKATTSAVYTPDHNEICSNYQFSVVNGNFRMSTGGYAVGQPHNLPGGPKSILLTLP
ncbi:MULTISPECIES: DUF3472 domain-containing protein [unclassified Burkholderia]|uniref:DUF3472 domain-containing protein n=1 Tax=unclassified Burkholderia TaxID=2613784 RepID=UPI00068F280A|nr:MULTISPECIES: DUF3472 domain-containing protein [unclassified Burkholderia]AOK49307.1 hypothetical protein WT60_20425 [Burkholderia sp. MSMB617WGS]KVK71810.1 hypothetical protein WS91_23330 [Burkholderia sp. MSMB1498]